MIRLAGSWQHRRERATFDEFTWRDGTRVRFNGQRPTEAKRFRQRVWPVFWRIRRPRQTTEAWHLRRMPLAVVLYERSMVRAHRIEAARRWWVEQPLTRHWFQVDEAISATRGTCA